MQVKRYLFGWKLLVVLICGTALSAQNAGSNAGSVGGSVVDQNGGVVVGAQVTVENPVSHFSKTVQTDSKGSFRVDNVPYNNYHVAVTAKGFNQYEQDIDVRSPLPLQLKLALKVGTAETTITVEGEDLVETDPTAHTDIDRGLFDKLPLENRSSGLSSLVTLASPGIAADSNGLFHGLGDHAENSFSVDGQPITDQQSKVFSNQVPLDAVQSLEVIQGAPPAEYGGKTSVVIDVTTRSGLGSTKPTGDVTTSYGSFGTSNLGFDFADGGQKWGNFISVSGLNSGRFLDPPEFVVMHDKGNEENFFDRFDFKPSDKNSLQLNLGYTRSWFQTPNSYDAENATAWSGLVVDNNGLGPDGKPVPVEDQRSQIKTYSLAPTYTRVLSNSTLLSVGAWMRQDQYHYYPSADPFADLTPNLQSQSTAQQRGLSNIGGRTDFTYVKGAHNIKVGATYQQTLLNERDTIGIVDPTDNPVCLNTADGSPDTNPNLTNPNQCVGALEQNQNFQPLLGCYDLTRTAPLPVSDGCAAGQTRSASYFYHSHTDVKEAALFAEDSFSYHNWTFNLGVRGDFYNGLTAAKQAEPRVGGSYNIKGTNTVLRASYAHTMESPFNENLILSSTGCTDPVIAAIMLATQLFPCTTSRLTPGIRNEYHAGLDQAFGRYFVVGGEYIWKYTQRGYDFNVLGATPITLPIEWAKSKIPGFALHASMPNYRGLTVQVVMSSVAARFFPPALSGIGPAAPPGVFRIDHDERFNETTHLQYQPWKTGPWVGFSWRYDSGLVAGATPCYAATATCSPTTTTLNGEPAVAMLSTITALPLSPDQQFQAGLTCGGVHATPTVGLPGLCLASQLGSTLINVPATGTENDDHNPQRIAPRSLYDMGIGDDNIFKGSEKGRWSIEFTGINIANTEALYNFLSTFSGTHYVTPRTLTLALGYHF